MQLRPTGMIAAGEPIQRAADAKLLVVAANGRVTHAPRASLLDFLRRGDLVIANDAATLPANLRGVHLPTGAAIEVRLAGCRSLEADALRQCTAVVFGAGDFRTPTEHRPAPPPLEAGDRLALGPLCAAVERTLGHPRLISLRFDGALAEIWSGIARHGQPIQYAHLRLPLDLWDVWMPIAGRPMAFEPASASFALDWRMLGEMRRRRIEFATLTHAAGISSTGDLQLDRRLPFDEPYFIAAGTARAVHRARSRGGRIVAIGTTVTRALEHAAAADARVGAGAGVADQRIGASTSLRVVDALLSGTHEPGTSHHDLLRAFVDDATLREVDQALAKRGYRTHEYGDSMLLERMAYERSAGCHRRRGASPGTTISGAPACR